MELSIAALHVQDTEALLVSSSSDSESDPTPPSIKPAVFSSVSRPRADVFSRGSDSEYDSDRHRFFFRRHRAAIASSGVATCRCAPPAVSDSPDSATEAENVAAENVAAGWMSWGELHKFLQALVLLLFFFFLGGFFLISKK